MRGTVSVYKDYETTPIIQENNLIVDGFKEHIVDLMTRIPAPTGIEGEVSASYNASNFTVQAMTFGPAQSNFSRIHALAAASGYVNTGATTTSLTALDPADGTSWFYNSDVTNYQFSAVNTSAAGVYKNSKLTNPGFTEFISKLTNPTFANYSYDESLSGYYINTLLELAELNGWSLQSYLRYSPSSSEFDDSYHAGSCSRYDMSAVSAVYSLLSGTSTTPTYANADDGILYIRSFATSSEGDTSGAVKLSQPFYVFEPDMEPLLSRGNPGVVAEVTCQFSSVSGLTTDSCIHINIQDETTGEYYHFSGDGTYGRHSWGGSGTPLVIEADSGTSGTVSKFFNVPNEKARNRFRVIYSFFTAGTADPLGCYFWNANVNLINGWYFGNIYEGGDIQRVINNDYTNPNVYFACSSVNDAPESLPISSVTYISQSTNLSPLKKYQLNFRPSSDIGVTNAQTLYQGVFKWSSSDLRQINNYNYLSQIGCSGLLEHRLPPTFSITPYLPKTSDITYYHDYFSKATPEDLCIEVSGNSSISGIFETELSSTGILSGKVLRNFLTGARASNLEVTLFTSSLDVQGNQLYFDFFNGTWSPSGTRTVFNTSSIITQDEYGMFETIEIDFSQLRGRIATNANNKIDIILQVANNSDESEFFKQLKILGASITENFVEAYKFQNTIEVEAKWNKKPPALSTRNNLLSGLTYENLVRILPDNTGINRYPAFNIESMFAAAGSVHDTNSLYEIMVGLTRHQDAGKFIKLNQVFLSDAALTTVSNDVSENTFTSESYFGAPKFDIVDEFTAEWNDASTLYPSVRYTSPGISTVANSTLTDSDFKDDGIIISTPGKGSVTQYPEIKLGYATNYSSLNFPTSSTDVAFGFTFSVDVALQSNAVKFQVAATTKDGDVVWWDASTSAWEKVIYGNEPRNDFKFVIDVGGVGNINDKKYSFSTPITIPSTIFDNTTKIKFYITAQSLEEFDTLFVSDWVLYTITDLPLGELPEFPSPEDRTIQTPKIPSAPLGHYTNTIQYNQDLTGVSELRGLGSANWAPSAGTSALYVSGNPQTSTSNRYAVVNSEGFVLSGYSGAISNAYVRGFFTSAGATYLRYLIDISGDDFEFFGYQGGIGALGLWAFDIDATYKKLKDNGHSLSAIYDKTAPWAGGLYTLDDETRNPVFKLLSKKVFREPITITGTAPNVVRIVWDIYFM